MRIASSNREGKVWIDGQATRWNGQHVFVNKPETALQTSLVRKTKLAGSTIMACGGRGSTVSL